MPAYTFSGGNGVGGFDMLQWSAADIIGMVANVLSSSHSATHVTYDNGFGEILTINGTFTGFDEFGDPTGGTVTSFSYTTSRFQFTAGGPMTISGTGLSLDVVTLGGWVATDNFAALQAALFGAGDTFTGSNGGDTILGQGGADTLNGGTGNDTLIGGTGTDTLNGGNGDDRMLSQDADAIDGGAGIDFVDLNRSSSALAFSISAVDLASAAGAALADGTTIKNTERFAIVTGSGADVLTFVGALPTGPLGELNSFNGGAGIDRLVGDFSATAVAIGSFLTWSNVEELQIQAGSGADVLDGGTGADQLSGNAGNDTLRGNAGSDTLNGGDGDDTLEGGAGVNTLNGGAGDDTIAATNVDTADGGAGEDLYRLDASAVSANIAATFSAAGIAISGATFSFTNMEHLELTSGSGNDTFTVTGPVTGRFGFVAGAGIDRLTADLSWLTVQVTLGLPFGNLQTSDNSLSAVLGDIEEFHVTAGSGNDVLMSGAGADRLIGGSGDDLIHPGTGSDFVDGGAGVDTLTLDRSGSAAGLSFIASEFLSAAGATLADGSVIKNMERFNFVGGASDDTFDMTGATGLNSVSGNGGTDALVMNLSGATTTVALDAANSSLSSSTVSLSTPGIDRYVVTSGSANDTLMGGAGADVLSSGAGNDTVGASPRDVVNGGSGRDILVADTRSTSANVAAVFTPSSTSFSGVALTASNFEMLRLSTGSGNDQLTVSGFPQSFTQTETALVFDGGAGLDTLVADFSTIATSILVSSGNITIRSFDSANDLFFFSAAVESMNVTTGSADDNITGGEGADTFHGGGGRDRFILAFTGGVPDVAFGDGGNDLFENFNAGSTIDGGAGVDKIRYSGFVHSGGFTYDFRGMATAAGATVDGSLIKNVESADIFGGNGADTFIFGNPIGENAVIGEAGVDTLVVDFSNASTAVTRTTDIENNLLLGTADGVIRLISIEAVLLTGSAFDDVLLGLGSASTLVGGAGNDTLVPGSPGADHLLGGPGNDIYSAVFDNDVVVELQGEGTDTVVVTSGGYVLGDNLENLRIFSTFTIGAGNALDNLITSGLDSNSLLGRAGDDTLRGDGGDDYLQGDAGSDILDGGDGSDTAGYLDSASAVHVDLGAGIMLGGDAVGDTYLSIENIAGSAFNDTLVGSGASNTLTGAGGADSLSGGLGDDVLDGGAGADILDGGGGSDIASYLSSASGLTINLATPGQNTGDAAGDTLASIEGLKGSLFDDVLTGDASASRLFGSDGADTLSGGGGDDVLDGGDGADMLDGGSGIDTADYSAPTGATSSTQGAVTVNLQTGTGLGGSAQGDVLANIDNVIGSDFNDVITGSAGANALIGGDGGDTLFGRDGDDTLIGGAAGDFLAGGAGIDTADYATSGASVAIDLNAVSVIGSGGDAGGDILVSIENIIGSAFADALIGRDFFANMLSGGDGDDALSGGTGGADVMNGGNGIDTLDYSLSPNGVDVRLFSGAASGGAANGDTYSSIENLIGSATKTDTLAGDAGVNQIWGGGGNETITGREGGDTLHGEAGNDTLLGGADSDTLIGGVGADTLGGGSQDDLVDYSASNAGVTVNLQTGSGTGGHAQGDVFVSIEDVTGSEFADVIIGKNNVWDNVFDGRGGNDTYTGGLGNDVFVFRANSGADTVTDFSASALSNNDTVQLIGFGPNFDTFAEVIAAASQVGADTLIDFGAGQTLTLQNVNLASLTSGDFIFG